jgi:hypothetical protein
VENAGWMTAEVRRQIEDLQRTHGFEVWEAVAYWHLSEARRLMIRSALEDQGERREAREAEHAALPELTGLGRGIADAMSFAAESETRISQHFSALYRDLGLRVLRRSYPEGWSDTRI